MRILCLSNMYPPHALGGYELACRDAMERFRERGHEITVLTTTMRVPGVPDVEGERAGGVLRDLEFYWEDHRLISPPLLRRAAIERENQRALRAALDRSRPDVVSVWNMGAMSLGLLSAIERHQIPMILNIHDEWLVYGPNLDAWTRVFAHRRAAGALVSLATRIPTRSPRLTDATVCFTNGYLKKRSAEGSSWKPGVATVVYLGIDERDFPVLGPKRAPWRWKLLVAGRLDERKGTHVAIRALSLLPPEATLDVVGTGDPAYRASLEALARDLGVADRVTFEVASRAQLRDRYREADVVLFPVIWQEPFGLVPIEAMSCATPVVATGTGGSAEFLSDEVNCLLAPPGDEHALAEAVKRLADDTTLRYRVVDGGLDTARVLTFDAYADALERWHLATAEHFVNGYPPERRSPLAAR